MKFVYVLVSDSNDCYAEQTYISMYSLRRSNPGCRIVLATDEPTLQQFEGSRSLIRDYADEVVCFEVPDGYTTLQRSRHIKTTIRQKITGDFLYLDADTLILGDLSDLESVVADIAAIRIQDGRNWGLTRPHNMLKGYNNMRGIDREEDHGISDYHNGGVILAKDAPAAHALFESWHRIWSESSTRYGYHKDQPALWLANRENNNVIADLDGKYNMQATCPTVSLQYLGDCRVFHYISTAKYLKNFNLKNRDFLERLIVSGRSEELDALLDNAKTDYLNGLMILTDPDELNWIHAPLVQIARKISDSFPVLDKLIIKINRLIHKG